MAHNINFSNGKHSFVAKGKKAWHGLGQYVQDVMTAEEVIKLSGLDYTVEKKDLFTRGSNDELIEVPGFYSTVRVDTNESLGVVGSRYNIVQNRDAFSFFDSIIDSGEAIFETAGVLGKGEKIFVTAKLPDDMLVKGEKIEKYILLTNSHDGSTTIIAGMTQVRVVCNNTLQASLKSIDNKVSIIHNSSAVDNLKEASKVMGISSIYSNEVNLIFERMADTRMTDLEIQNYIENALRNDYVNNTKEELKEASKRLRNLTNEVFTFALTHETQTTDAAYRTLWGAYNSISAYYTHMKSYNSTEQRMKDISYGNGSNKINKAFELAKEMI
jgi:phage/plasmid-like protein (TIGR03299 family)